LQLLTLWEGERWLIRQRHGPEHNITFSGKQPLTNHLTQSDRGSI
jgi:hypothetical protein